MTSEQRRLGKGTGGRHRRVGLRSKEILGTYPLLRLKSGQRNSGEFYGRINEDDGIGAVGPG